ncbi:MAG: hypothetical protein H0V26_12475 [Solirubrobacterales bacterium]|nr:hypothetical protein [Solirubrobacterales bacterium]
MALVESQDRGAVRHVILNRPEKRNAFDAALVAGVSRALRDAAEEPAIHCVVVRGEGSMLEVAMQELCARSEDFAEGARAVAERRQPDFHGR